MFKPIFNFFEKINLFVSKNKKGLIFLVMGLFLLFTPVHTVHAGILDNIYNFLKDTISIIINLPLNLVILVSVLSSLLGLLISTVASSIVYIIIVTMADWIMRLSMSVAISPSSADISPIIQTGWNFTSGFVNMFFLLTLTFIGLATILRLKDYEAKQLLPKVLLIAILVNFTPVIIGFVVDMGNLVTNFFVEKTALDINELTDFITGSFNTEVIGDYVKSAMGDLFGSPINFLVRAVSLMVGLITPIVYVLVGIYVYICMAAMFFLRIIMLWILTILSPIAFFSYIFPKGSTLRMLFPGILSWEEWWEEFLKWVIVGIPFGLFLYISQEMIGTTGLFNDPGIGGMTIEFGGVNIDLNTLATKIIEILPRIASLMMLYMGYKISMDAAPKMAKSMMSSVGKIAMVAATGGVGAMAGAGARGMGGVASGLERVSGKLGGVSAKKGGFLLKPAAKGLGGLSKLARKGESGLTRAAMKNKPKVMSGFDEMNAGQQLNATKGIVGKRARLEHYNKMDWGKVSKEEKDKMIPEIEGMIGKGNLKNEYGDTFKKMSKAGISSEKIRLGLSSDPEKAKEAINDKAKEIKENINQDDDLKKEIDINIVAKYGKDASEENKEQFMKDLAAQTLNFEELKPGDLKDLGKDGITSLSARLGSHKLAGNGLNNIRNNYGDATFDKLFKGTGGIDKTFKGKDGYKELMIKNPRLARHLLTNKEGVTFGWNQVNNKSISDGEGGVNYKKVIGGFNQYKALRSADPENVIRPEGMNIPDNEKATRESLVSSSIVNDEEAKEKYKSLLSDSKKTEPNEIREFRDGYIEAEAERQLIAERSRTQKGIEDLKHEVSTAETKSGVGKVVLGGKESSRRRAPGRVAKVAGEAKEKAKAGMSGIKRVYTTAKTAIRTEKGRKILKERVKEAVGRSPEVVWQKIKGEEMGSSARELYRDDILKQHEELNNGIKDFDEMDIDIQSRNQEIRELQNLIDGEDDDSIKDAQKVAMGVHEEELDAIKKQYMKKGEEIIEKRKSVEENLAQLQKEEFPDHGFNVDKFKKVDYRNIRKVAAMDLSETPGVTKMLESIKPRDDKKAHWIKRYKRIEAIKNQSGKEQKLESLPYEFLGGIKKEDREKTISAIKGFNKTIDNIKDQVSQMEKLREERKVADDIGTVKTREHEINDLAKQTMDHLDKLNKTRKEIRNIVNEVGIGI